MKQIPHNRPTIGNDEAKAVAKILKSRWLVAGEEVTKLEETIKRLTNRRYALAVNTGTAALHLSLLTLGIKTGDEVILPSYTVSDVVNAIYYTGATPVLIDAEKDSPNIDPKQIKEKVTKKTKAVIIPHMLGLPANIDEIQRFNVPVIEDCAQSIGSYYKNKPTGSFGDLSIFSFYASKVITSGQGGMIATNDKKYYEIIKDLIDYNGRDNYKIRYNYPMTDIQAAIGNVQLKKLEVFIARRKKIAIVYRKILTEKGIAFWPKDEMMKVNYFRFVIRFTNRQQRDYAQAIFAKNNIETITPYRKAELLHNLLSKNAKAFPNTETLSQTTLSLPIFPSLQDSTVEHIAKVLYSLPIGTLPNAA